MMTRGTKLLSRYLRLSNVRLPALGRLTVRRIACSIPVRDPMSFLNHELVDRKERQLWI